jgi:hypothetical protein
MRYHDPEHRFEKDFWGDCCNTFAEEMKQLEYARRMQLMPDAFFRIDARNKNILDIGGGPVSLLLKCYNLGDASRVLDPIRYPEWVYYRYSAHGIWTTTLSGEDAHSVPPIFDEVWIYNTLQHCVDPEKIIANAKRAAPVLRIFEWVNFPPHPGHPHELKSQDLDRWIGSGGANIEYLSTNGCYGMSYYGVFKHV